MTKETYLKQLRHKLRKLPEEEIESAIEYYTEYFDEAGEENTQSVINELGSPASVASKILADFAVKDLSNHPNSAKKSLSAVWLIVLAIFASPIAIPLLIGVCALIFGLFVTGAALIFSFFAFIFSLVIGGIISIIGGFAVITQDIPSAIFFIGIGLTIGGVGLLLFPPLLSIGKTASIALVKLLKKLFDKLTKKQKEEL